MKIFTAEIPVKIRFSDTDAMGVVWHGNYLRFFEDAREAFGMQYGMTYLNMYHNGFFTPIVKSNVEHKSPINYGETVMAIAKLKPSPAAKIVFEFDIMNTSTGKLSAIGSTTQVFLHAEDRSLELIKPAFYEKWEKLIGINHKL